MDEAEDGRDWMGSADMVDMVFPLLKVKCPSPSPEGLKVPADILRLYTGGAVLLWESFPFEPADNLEREGGAVV